MEITKNNLNQAISALYQCAKENKGKFTSTGEIRVSDLCTDVAKYLESQKQLLTGDIINGCVSSQKGSTGIVSSNVFELPKNLLVGDKVRLLLIV